MRKSLGFWLVYALAWFPFVASYTTYYFKHLGRPLSEAVLTSLTGILPAALLGVGVIAICVRLPWSGKRPTLFLSTHLLLGVLYFELWIGAARILSGFEEKIENAGGVEPRSSAASFDAGMISGLLIYATIAAIIYGVDAMERLRAEEMRVAQLEGLRARAELETLRAQLNPHFLFNTLHSLMALVRHDPSAAEAALEKLASLLRHTLMTSSQTNDVALRDELDFVQSYLSLERIRFGNRLQVEESVEKAALDCFLPAFTLQPLVENSIKHAIDSRPQGGILTIKANRNDDVLKLEVMDNGPGTHMEDLSNTAGSGLRIARQRLNVRYSGRAAFQINTGPGQGFAVRMEIPQATSS